MACEKQTHDDSENQQSNRSADRLRMIEEARHARGSYIADPPLDEREERSTANSLLRPNSAPAFMKKALPWGEKDFVRKQTDQNDHKHDADDLIHGVQFAAVVQ